MTLSWAISMMTFPLYLGVPHDVLKSEYFVPNSSLRRDSEKYRNKEQFGEIFTITEKTTLTYSTRVIEVGKLQCSSSEWLMRFFKPIFSSFFIPKSVHQPLTGFPKEGTKGGHCQTEGQPPPQLIQSVEHILYSVINYRS